MSWMTRCVAVAALATSTIATTTFGVASVQSTGQPTAPVTIHTNPEPLEAIAAFGSVWVNAEGDRTVIDRIDPSSNTVVARIGLGDDASTAGNYYPADSMEAFAGSLWVSEYFEDRVLRIDPATNRVVARVRTGLSPSGIVAGGGHLYIAEADAGKLARVSSKHNRVSKEIRIGGPGKGQFGEVFPQLTSFDHSIWTMIAVKHLVLRINPISMRITGRYRTPKLADCGFVRAAPGGFWIDDSPCGIEYDRYDIASRSIVASFTDNVCQGTGDVFDGFLYTVQDEGTQSTCSDAYVAKRSLTTGAVLATSTAGGQAFTMSATGGSLWVSEEGGTSIVRLPVF